MAAAPQAIAPPPQGEWVVDTAGVLTTEAVDQLNALSRAINATGKAQLGIAVINTTSGVAPRAFATTLFNSWEVGHAATNDGVLIFAAIADRKAEIILGSGSTLTPAQTDVVMREAIVANFKRGDASAAILAGALGIATLLQAGTGAPTPQAPEPEPAADPRYARLAKGEEAFTEYSPRHWLIDLTDSFSARDTSTLEVASHDLYSQGKGRLFILVTDNPGDWPPLVDLVTRLKRQVHAASASKVGVVALDIGSGRVAIDVPHDPLSSWERGVLTEQEHLLRDGFHVDRLGRLQSASSFAAGVLAHGMPPRPMADVLNEGLKRYGTMLLIGCLGSGVLALVFAVRWWRRRPRVCDGCTQPRLLLSQEAEREYLVAGQLAEEQVGSVQFDVWWCARCRDTDVVRHDTWFTRYKRCSGCGHKTALKTGGRTLRYATTYQGGLVEVTETCSHCGHVETYTRTTARLSETSTRSSYSSSSSSSRSSGSSFGGGSSSGSGSSGSW